jgi:hypothetical protein
MHACLLKARSGRHTSHEPPASACMHSSMHPASHVSAPAKPEDEDAEDGKGGVVAWHLLGLHALVMSGCMRSQWLGVSGKSAAVKPRCSSTGVLAHLAIFEAANAGAQNVSTGKRRDAANHVHWAAASKVDQASLEQAVPRIQRWRCPAVSGPSPYNRRHAQICMHPCMHPCQRAPQRADGAYAADAHGRW